MPKTNFKCKIKNFTIVKNDKFLLALRKPRNDSDKLIRSKKELLKIKCNLKGRGSRDEKKILRGKGSRGKAWNEGAQGAVVKWQTKRGARGGPGNKTLVNLMRGLIKGARRTKTDSIKGDGSKTKIVHSQVISCICVI